MNRKYFYFFTFLLFCLFCPSPARAQMVSDIKVFAVQEYDSLKVAAGGYSGGDKDLDFRKGRGGGYVFVLSKQSTDTASYITGVKVETKTEYGMKFNEGGKTYYPVPFFQAASHKDKDYRGGLNGRNYSIYGGAYTGQPHVYFSRTNHQDFNEKVLKDIYVTSSMPNLSSNQTYSGGHAGGGRYFVYTWHTHEPQYKPYITDAAPTGDINNHVKYCDRDQCGITKIEPHHFAQHYNGIDTWGQLPATDKKCADYHFKKCTECGQIVYEAHSWAAITSDWKSHNKRCLICDYVIQADHENFGKQKIPVDENYHMIFCDCGFLMKLRHDYSDSRFVERQDCEHTVVRYSCRQCRNQAYFEEPGVGHDYDEFGICRRDNCQHPYERPGVEPLDTLKPDGDSVFVVKTFGNLYWIADYVNNRRPKTNIRLANDLYAEDYMRLPWIPIGTTDSTAFKGTFNGDGHFISMLQTEEPVAGCGYRGLFGAIAEGATVKDLMVAGCNIRGWDYVGAIAGVNKGTIDNCHVAFSIMSTIGSGMNLGGICGMNKGTISRCSTEDNVWVGGVRDYAGGICGTNDGGNLTGNESAAICGSGSDAVLPEAASNN